MNKKDLTKTVCQLVSEHLAVPLKTVKHNIELPFLEYEDEDGEPCCDSIDQLGLTIAFEEEFGVEISPEHAEQLTTIKAVVDYLAPRLDETGEYKEEEEGCGREGCGTIPAGKRPHVPTVGKDSG